MPKDKISQFLRCFAAPTEVFIANQINSLKRFQPEVFCHHRDPQAPPVAADVFSLVDKLKTPGALLQRFAYSTLRFLTPPGTRLLLEELRFREVRLIHVHYLVDARFFLSVIKRSELPCLISCHGWDVSRFPQAWGGLGSLYLKQVFPHVDVILAMSKDMRQSLLSLGCPEEKIIVFYQGIPVKRFFSPGRKYNRGARLEILFCGRLVPKKAPGILLKALEIIEKEKLVSGPWKLTIVGDGPLRPDLERKVDGLRWAARVCFTGHIPSKDSRLVEAYHRADVFCLPSQTAAGDKEGVPGTVVEAMASGLPVISTRHAGIPEVVSDGVEGTLVEEGDAPALARALARALSDPAWREEKGRAAAFRARGLDLDSRIEDLEKIYRELIDRGRTI